LIKALSRNREFPPLGTDKSRRPKKIKSPKTTKSKLNQNKNLMEKTEKSISKKVTNNVEKKKNKKKKKWSAKSGTKESEKKEMTRKSGWIN